MNSLTDSEIETVSGGMSAAELFLAVVATDIALGMAFYQLGAGAANRDSRGS